MDQNKEFRQVHKVPVEKNKFVISTKMIAALVIAVALVVALVTGYFLTKKANSTNYVSKVTNGDKEVISGDVSITKQGYYEYLMDNSGASEVVSEAYTKIADKLLTSKEDKASIAKEQKTLENQYKTYMGSLKSYATTMGYDSVDDLRKNNIIPTAKQNALMKKYLNSEFKTVVNKYKVSYIKYYTYSKESQAIKAIKSIKSEADYTKKSKEASTTNDVGMLSTKTSSTVDENLTKKASTFYSMKSNGVYKNAVKLSTGSYAVVYVYNTDKTAKKADIVKTLSELDGVKEDVTAYYLKKYDFKVYDKALKKNIKKINKNYITE